MMDNKLAPSTVSMLNKSMNEIAHEIGEMDLDHPLRAERLKALCALSELSRSLKAVTNEMIYKRMDELAREMAASQPGDPRRAQILAEIIRLNETMPK